MQWHLASCLARDTTMIAKSKCYSDSYQHFLLQQGEIDETTWHVSVSEVKDSGLLQE